MAHSDNGWDEWSKYVLKELERLNACYENIETDLRKIHVEIATLQVKAGIFGAIGGAIPVIVIIALSYLKGM